MGMEDAMNPNPVWHLVYEQNIVEVLGQGFSPCWKEDTCLVETYV